MKQILFTGEDCSLVIELESDTVIPGSFINTEFNKPNDYRVQQLNKIADLANQAISKAVQNNKISINTTSQVLKPDTITKVSLSSVVSKSMTPGKPLERVIDAPVAAPAIELKALAPVNTDKIAINVKNSITVPVTFAQDGTQNVYLNGVPKATNLVSTYDDVMRHFAPADGKIFVTGYTSSKFSIIDKYFIKTNVAVTRKSYYSLSDLPIPVSAPALDLTKTQNFNVTLTPNISGGFDAHLETLIAPKPISLAVKKEPLFKNPGIVSMATGINNVPTKALADFTNNNAVRTKIRLLIPGLNYYAMILSEDTISGINEYVLYLDTENPIKYIDLGNGLTIFSYLRQDDQPDLTTNMILYDGYVEEPKIISEVFIDRGLNTAYEKVKKLKNVKSINELTKMGLGYYKINTRGYNFKNV